MGLLWSFCFKLIRISYPSNEAVNCNYKT
jgi:hypothetical protein